MAKFVDIDDVNIGDVLARTIYDDNQILLEENTEITERILKIFDTRDIFEVWIKTDDEVNEYKNKKILNEANKETKKGAESLFNAIKNGTEIDGSLVNNLVNKMYENLLVDTNIVLSYAAVNKDPNYLIPHSIKVATYAMVLASKMNLEKDKIINLGIAGLLQDSGMMKLEKVWNNSNKFTDNDKKIIVGHIQESLNIVKKISGINEEVLTLIENHHERIDGTGYPNGRKKDELTTEMKILQLTDVFSAVLSDRPYRKRLMSNDAMKLILSSGLEKFDLTIIKTFLKCVPLFPIGDLVKLNTNEIARVVRVTGNPFRPQVDILIDSKNIKLDYKMRKNLNSKEFGTIVIIEVLNEKDYGLDFAAEINI